MNATTTISHNGQLLFRLIYSLKQYHIVNRRRRCSRYDNNGDNLNYNTHQLQLTKLKLALESTTIDSLVSEDSQLTF